MSMFDDLNDLEEFVAESIHSVVERFECKIRSAWEKKEKFPFLQKNSFVVNEQDEIGIEKRIRRNESKTKSILTRSFDIFICTSTLMIQFLFKFEQN